MPTLLPRNADVLVTMDGQRRELRDAGIYAEDGIIKQVGPSAELPASADTVIALEGQIVLPGFVNTHHHLNQTNNAAERALRCIAVGRNNWTFAGSDAGGRRAAAIYTLIETAKLNDVDPQAWLTDVLARLQDHSAKRIDELLPWNWKRLRLQNMAA